MSSQLRIGTLLGAGALVLIILYVRFCGSVSLPNKPPPPQGPSGTQRELMTRSTGSLPIYKSFLESDAQTAGITAPTVAEMSKQFAYRVDEARHVLEPGQPPIDLAGLRLHVERTGNSIILVIENRLDSAIAYNITSAPSSGGALCKQASPLPFNAMIIEKGSTERRTECLYRDGMAIVVAKAETMELNPLSAWYVSQVPPIQVGVDEVIARGHRGLKTNEICSPVMPTVVRTGLDRGDIGWRDLVDFYARHRCQSYQFPVTYRAFKKDAERALPAVEG